MRLRGFTKGSWLVGLTAGISLGVGAASAADATAPPYTVYQHRAWYIYLISQYTEWPESAFADKSAPFVLGILGKDPLEKNLDLIKDKPIKNRPLRVVLFKEVAEIQACHALYICNSEQERFKEIMTALAGRPILTFGEMPPFRENQGMVTLWVKPETSDKGYLYFDINQAAAEKAGLRISSYVLKLARPEPRSPSSP